MKKLMLALVAALMSVTMLFSGCVTLSGVDARNGKDGQDFSIRDCYEEANAERAKNGLAELTFLDFLKEYLDYDGETLEQEASVQTSINRSLRCAVSVMAVFTVRQSIGWGMQQTTETASYGAGVIIDIDNQKGDALVVTNCHVIYNSAAISSKISDKVYLFLYGQETDYLTTCAISAEVISVSQSYDIALLKVENSGILKNSDAVAASFTTADDVYMGEEVYAIGNPEGYGISATKGIISKESENIQINLSSGYYQNLKEYRVIRTDAAINGGNSGGGLFNTDGYLVGIVNAKSSSSSVDNMGFALPSSNVRRLIQLMIDGYNQNGFSGNLGVTRAYLQAEYSSRPSSSKWNAEHSIYEIFESVYVTVAGDGLEKDDLITHIKLLDSSQKVVEDKEVTRLYHLDDTLLSARRGYFAVLTVSRNGETQEVTIKLDADKYFVAVD